MTEPIEKLFRETIGNRLRCYYCGEGCIGTKDHFYPKSLGGKTTVWSCAKCNRLKANLLPLDWIQRIRSRKKFDKAKVKRMVAATESLLAIIPKEVHDARLPVVEKVSCLLDGHIFPVNKPCACGVKTVSSDVNGFKITRYWQNGIYHASTNPCICKTGSR